MYVIGGGSLSLKGLKSLNVVERAKSENGPWDIVPPMATKRIDPCACTLQDRYIYVFGGNQMIIYLNSIEKFDSDTSVWKTLDVTYPVSEPMTLGLTAMLCIVQRQPVWGLSG